MRLQVPLLLGLRGLGNGGILTELLKTSLSILESVLGNTVVEPGHGLSNPLKQLKERRKEREREREREREGKVSLWKTDVEDRWLIIPFS